MFTFQYGELNKGIKIAPLPNAKNTFFTIELFDLNFESLNDSNVINTIICNNNLPN